MMKAHKILYTVAQVICVILMVAGPIVFLILAIVFFSNNLPFVGVIYLVSLLITFGIAFGLYKLFGALIKDIDDLTDAITNQVNVQKEQQREIVSIEKINKETKSKLASVDAVKKAKEKYEESNDKCLFLGEITSPYSGSPYFGRDTNNNAIRLKPGLEVKVVDENKENKTYVIKYEEDGVIHIVEDVPTLNVNKLSKK